MPEQSTIEIAAFPEPEELRKILKQFKSGKLSLEEAMYAIERLEEANIRFQNLAISQATFQLMAEAKEEQHRDLIALKLMIGELS